jgi:CheY-like chemotaxis protein
MIRRVLIADDEREIRNLLRMALEEEGYEVETRPNGKDALEFLSTAEESWIVLMDVMMPELTGPEVCQQLDYGEASGGERHRIVLMTGSGLQECDCPSSVCMLVRKPFELAGVVKVVASLANDQP